MIYGKLPIVLLSTMASQADDTTECRIAGYLLSRAGSTHNLSIAQAAQDCHVSVSSVSRFCRSIGLSDFGELRELTQRAAWCFELDSRAEQPEQRACETFRAIEDGLARLERSIDCREIERLCRKMDLCEHIFLIGLLKAGTAAQCLQADLLLQGKKTVCKLPFAQQIACLEQAGERDMIVIFSYSGVYFDYLRGQIPPGLRRAYVAFITGAQEMQAQSCINQMITFDSSLNQASHPFQMQAISRLIAQEYAWQHRRQA